MRFTRCQTGWRWLVCCLIGLAAPSLLAQTGDQRALLFAVTFWERKLITINVDTGRGTLLTNLSMSSRDLTAFRGALYSYGPSGDSVKLSQLDPPTGKIRGDIVITNQISGGEGAMDVRADGIAFASASDGATGTLFQIQLDLTNATLITTSGGLNPSMDGLAFDTNGVLYGLSQNRGGNYALYIINQITGATTLVGGLGISFPASGGVVAGLAFAPDGQLYAAVGNPTESKLLRVNKTTGLANEVGPIGFAGVSGIRFFAQPPGPLVAQTNNAEIRLAWPVALGGLLETAASVNGPWTNANPDITIIGAEASALLPRNEAQAYFRLTR